MGIIDTIIPEPPSGALTDHEAAAESVGNELRKQLAQLKALSLEEMLNQRYAKFRKMAQYFKEG